MAVCESRRASRRREKREAPKKKGRRARAWQPSQGGFGYFASPLASQITGSNGQGFGGSTPTYGQPPTYAPPPQVTPDAPPPIVTFDPSGTFRAPDGRWLMSQR